MKDIETQNRFVELRAQGWSFARIAEELHVSKAALVEWSRKFQFQIQNLRAIHNEALCEKYLLSQEARLEALGTQLRKLEEEIARRDISELPTSRLIALAATLRRDVGKETRSFQFSTPCREIPDQEKVYEAHDWQA